MIYIAKNMKEKKLGYNDGSSLSTAPAILFPNTNNITMANTGKPLRIIFLRNGKPIKEVKGTPYEKEHYIEPKADSVLEIPIFRKGGSIKSIIGEYDNTARMVDDLEVFEYLKSKGVSTIHALAMINNIKFESDFNFNNFGDKDKETGLYTSYGLFQWHNERLENLKNYSDNWREWKTQVDYALNEDITKKFLNTDFQTATQASQWFTIIWERPADAGNKAVERSSNLINYANLLKKESLNIGIVDELGSEYKEAFEKEAKRKQQRDIYKEKDEIFGGTHLKDAVNAGYATNIDADFTKATFGMDVVDNTGETKLKFTTENATEATATKEETPEEEVKAPEIETVEVEEPIQTEEVKETAKETLNEGNDEAKNTSEITITDKDGNVKQFNLTMRDPDSFNLNGKEYRLMSNTFKYTDAVEKGHPMYNKFLEEAKKYMELNIDNLTFEEVKVLGDGRMGVYVYDNTSGKYLSDIFYEKGLLYRGQSKKDQEVSFPVIKSDTLAHIYPALQKHFNGDKDYSAKDVDADAFISKYPNINSKESMEAYFKRAGKAVQEKSYNWGSSYKYKNGGILTILDENGKPQMKIEEGARIFSRIHTEKLMNMKSKLLKNPNDKDYEQLGKMITQFINKQNSNNNGN